MPQLENIDKTILKEYCDAAFMVSVDHFSNALKDFSIKYPNEYRTITAMSRKRKELKKDIYAMETYSKSVAWFTLTFDNLKDKNLIDTKRKESFKFLNSVFALFVIVEENGEKYERYHVHGFGVFRHDKKLEDFYKWHSRESIYLMPDHETIDRKIKYLTKYAVKDVPRLHRNKNLIILRKTTDKTMMLKRFFRDTAIQKEANNAFLCYLDFE